MPKRNNTNRGLNYSQIYGEERAREIKQKLSISHKGNTTGFQIGNKIRLGKKRLDMIGKALHTKSHTKESKKKMSIAKMGHIPWNKNKGNGSINSQGYKTLRINGMDILEHHYVWCSQPYNLSYIPKGFCIHHKDLNTLNNNPDNLFLMAKSDHTKLHNILRIKINEKYKYWGKNQNLGGV